MGTTFSRGESIVLLVLSGFTVGTTIANIIYFNRIINTVGVTDIVSSPLSLTEATSIRNTNVIILILGIAAFLYAIYALYRTFAPAPALPSFGGWVAAKPCGGEGQPGC